LSRLEQTLDRLRAHESELHRPGVAHAAVFGSVGRGDDQADSDVEVLIDLDRGRPMRIFV
jgi:predicted nucleotidyltransferase